MARAAVGDAKAASLARGGPYVFLKDGPYHGSFYSVSDWEVTREAERYSIEHGAQRPEVMGLYRETKDTQVCHDPKLPGLAGRVWRWTGKREPINPLTGRRAH